MKEKHGRCDYCLVLMPNVALQTNIQPATGLGLLSAYLKQAGYQGQVLYANLLFMQEFEFHLIKNIHDVPIMLGDWLFAHILFPELDTAENLTDYMRLLKMDLAAFSFINEDAFRLRMTECRRKVAKYLDDLVDRVISLEPDMVGCGVTYSQHLPALAFMKKLKEKAPSIVTVMGGPNCERKTGATTHREFPFVDYVVSGEGDDIIVPLMTHIRESRGTIPITEAPCGLYVPDHRHAGYPPTESWLAVKENLDNLPLPDFDDFFREATALQGFLQRGEFYIPFEASRGCWWAQKHACTFCSVNGVTSTYRSRPAEQVLLQLTELAAKYDVDKFFAVDSILDMNHIKQLMPGLASLEPKFDIFFEVSGRLKKEELQVLASAGVTWVQPGIESLDSRVLRLMNKATDAWQNIQFLKHARELGLYVTWNVLYGFPDEQDEWYDEMADIIGLLSHLQPPATMMSIMYMRNSTYFHEQERFGLKLCASPINQIIWALDPDVLEDMTYIFENTVVDTRWGMRDGMYHAPMGRERAYKGITKWQKLYDSPAQPQPVLIMTDRLDCLEITDTRAVAVQASHRLTGLLRKIYLYCETAPKKDELLHRLSDEGVERPEVEKALTTLVESRLLLKVDGRLLALALAVSEAPHQGDNFAAPAGKKLDNWLKMNSANKKGPTAVVKAPLATEEYWGQSFLTAPGKEH